MEMLPPAPVPPNVVVGATVAVNFDDFELDDDDDEGLPLEPDDDDGWD